MTKKVWYLDHALHDYNEDVKSLARDAGLLLVDGRVTSERINAAETVPTVTLKGQKNTRKAKVEVETEESTSDSDSE